MADQLIQQGNQAVSQLASDTGGNPIYGFGGDPSLGASQYDKAVTLDQLKPATPITNLPQSTANIPAQANATNTATQSTPQTVQDYVTALTPPTTQTDQRQQSILDQIASLSGQDTGKQQYELQQESNYGLPKMQQELSDLNGQLTTGQAEYNQLQAEYQNKQAMVGGNNGVETSPVYDAQQAGLTKAYNSSLALKSANNALIAAQIQAKTGNINTAISLAQKATDMHYAPIEDNIKVLQAQLQAIQPLLDKEQKTQALAQQAKLQQDQQDLADKKAQAKQNQQLALTAGIGTKFTNQNGTFFNTQTGETYATPQDFFNAAGVSSFEQAYQQGLVTDINNAKLQDINTVSQMVAKYPDAGIKINDSLDSAVAKLKNSAIYRKDTYIARPAGSTISSLGGQAIDLSNITDKNAPQSAFGGLSYNGLLQKAQVYLTNGGNIQGLGLSGTGDSKAQRTAIMNYAGQLAEQMGMNIPQITAMYKANSKAATDVISRVAKIDTTAQSLAGQFPRLANLAGKVSNLGITESDVAAGAAAAQRKFGSVDAANYIELVQTVRGDYAAMQAAVGGSRGGQFFAESAKDAIPLGLTPDQYLGIQDTISQSANIALSATNDEANKLLGISQTKDNGQSVRLKDPKTGEVRTFTNLSQQDLQDALNQGYIQQ